VWAPAVPGLRAGLLWVALRRVSDLPAFNHGEYQLCRQHPASPDPNPTDIPYTIVAAAINRQGTDQLLMENRTESITGGTLGLYIHYTKAALRRGHDRLIDYSIYIYSTPTGATSTPWYRCRLR
jgi:hypothetical protein